jgi:hypothetical protein
MTRKHGTVARVHGNLKARKKTPNIFVDLSKTKIAERRKNMLQDFKNFNVDASDLDELVALSAFGKQLRGEFEAQKVAVPEYVSDNLNSLAREIDSRMADRRATRVRELKAQRDSLKTAQERRDAIDKELAALGETVGV